MLKKIEIQTKKKVEFVDITPKINEAIKENGTREGVVIVLTQHTTSGLTINENEPNLLEDMEKILGKVVPQDSYLHDRIDNNAQAHLQSLYLEHSLSLPFHDSSLILGTWQKVFLVELDGPRSREVLLKF